MKFYIEHIDYSDFLSVHGWLFDAERTITRVEIAATGRSGTNSRTASWGFVRNDVYVSQGQVEAALKSGFHVYGLQVGTQAQIDLKVTYEHGRVREIPIALFNLEEVAGNQSPRIVPLTQLMTRRISSVARSAPARDLQHVIGCFQSLTSEPAAIVPKVEPDKEPEIINVLVSVYKGLHFLEPFFESLFADPGHSAFEVYVVDNGNTDPAVIECLRQMHQRYQPVMRLIRVEDNEGYIKGICTAYEAAPAGRHVVVLNTDLVLPRRWLSRLIQPLLDYDDIATVTPFTNAGSSCSFPITGEDNQLFRDLPVDVIDGAFQDVSWPEGGVTLPSGVGFCMAHNKEVLAKIGYYEPETFGFGYGEENDWSLKAHRLGYRNILLPSMYVWHKHGGVYLAEEKRELIARNGRIINARYPEYPGMVNDYFSRDILLGLRALIVARLIATKLSAPVKVLIAELDQAASAVALREKNDVCEQGGACIWINALGGHAVQVSVFVEELAVTFRTSSPATLLALLKLLHVREINVYALFPNRTLAAAFDALAAVPPQDRVALHLHIADYTLFCPSRDLINHAGVFCNLPEPQTCQGCLSRMAGSVTATMPAGAGITSWRDQWKSYLRITRRITWGADVDPGFAQRAIQSLFAGKL